MTGKIFLGFIGTVLLISAVCGISLAEEGSQEMTRTDKTMKTDRTYRDDRTIRTDRTTRTPRSAVSEGREEEATVHTWAGSEDKENTFKAKEDNIEK